MPKNSENLGKIFGLAILVLMLSGYLKIEGLRPGAIADQ